MLETAVDVYIAGTRDGLELENEIQSRPSARMTRTTSPSCPITSLRSPIW